MKKIDNSLLYKYSFLGRILSNEKGNRAIFLRQTANREENSYDANLYLYENEKISKLTSCSTASEAFWYDDETIAFISKRDEKSKKNKEVDSNKKSEPSLQLYTKNVISSSESELWLELKGQIYSINMIDKEKLVYLKTRDIVKEDSEYFSGQQDEEGFMRIRRLPFYLNGANFTFNKRTVLCIYDIKNGKEKEIDCKDYTVESIELSKDKNKIIIMASKMQKLSSKYTALFEYKIKSNEIKKILNDESYSSKNPYGIYAATYFNNKPFFLGSTMEKHGINENRIAYVIENDGKVNILNRQDINYLNSGVQDMVLSGGNSYKVFDDNIDFITTSGTINKISRLYSNGIFEEDIFEFKGSISCFDYVDDKLIFVGLDPNGGQEIYFEDKKISNFHKFLNDYYVALPQPLNIKSTGFDIEGFILLPEDYDKKSSHPAVLEIHGGPKTAYQTSYFHEMQMLVSEGYVVLFCNPRGSSGKGNEFFDIFGLYGQVDYQNIIDFTKAVLEKYDKIDKERLFVTGGSYGGFMTNYIVGKTNMFRAAVTQRSISNWISFYGTSDIGYYFATDQHRAKIEDDDFWQQLWDVSPLKNIDNVKTPTMIIHSDHDFRCPLEQGYQFFTALMDRGIDTELLVFKDENHGLSRGGKPKNRIERLNAIKTWFAKYDKK